MVKVFNKGYKQYIQIKILMNTLFDGNAYVLFQMIKLHGNYKVSQSIKSISSINKKYNELVHLEYDSLEELVTVCAKYQRVSHSVSVDLFINRCNYNRDLAERIYRKYCKLKTRNFTPPRLDTRSLDFCITRYGEEAGRIRYDKLRHQAGVTLRKEYYLNKGFTEEEARAAISKRQATFSLKKCIEKHGEVEGLRLWEDRQQRWQATLKSKPQEEIDDINRRKSSKVKSEIGNRKGILYYIRFYNEEIEFWKIGITSKRVEQRFGSNNVFKKLHNLYYDVKYVNHYETMNMCFDVEQSILDEFKLHRVTINYNGFKTTEAFNVDITQYIHQI